jgi:putative membrane protein
VQPLAPVVALALLYAAVLARHGRDAADRLTPLRVLAGIAGLVALALALGPPLDGWAASDLAAHMVQHVALLTVVPPLLILGCVPVVVVRALPTDSRQRVTRAAGRLAWVVRAVPPLYQAAGAIVLQTVVLGVWHLPRFYDAAAANNAVHALEHASFLGAGLVFWWCVAGLGSESGPAWAVVCLFVASLPATLLGALMTLSTAPWYPYYATGTTAHALARQQLAGVVMWGGGGMVYVVSAAALFAAWLARMEQSTPARARMEPAH